jgi:signal peptide peptidase SppA
MFFELCSISDSHACITLAGDALSSDLMWRQMQLLKASGKPVVASVTSVAASGGYYIAMGADHIVAEEQSITGSIGVVSAKFNASKLFKKIGYNVERLSRGRYAEVYALERDFTEDERKFWKDLAWHSYKAFVSKAARSRGMRTDAMHRRAQGRVWSGVQGLGLGLVDEIGGLHTAVARAHHMVEARATETRAFKVAAKHTAAEKAQQSGLQGWKFRNFMDVQRFVKLAGGLEAAEVLLPTLPSARELVLQKRQGKGKPRPLKTRVKYIYPPSPNPLAALLSVAGLQAAEEPSQIEFILRQAALSTGRPMALIDDVIGQALPGIGLVPESLRVLGIGPLENQLLGGDVTAILKCLDRLLRP